MSIIEFILFYLYSDAINILPCIFSDVSAFNSLNEMVAFIISILYMRSGGPERLRNLPKVTQLGIETPDFLLPGLCCCEHDLAFFGGGSGGGTSALIEKKREREIEKK